MLKRLLYEIVNRIAMIHDLINKVNNRLRESCRTSSCISW